MEVLNFQGLQQIKANTLTQVEKGVYFALEKWVIQGFKTESASHLISK